MRDASVASRDEVLGVVSHDLRTLLQGVALNVSILARGANSGDSPGATKARAANVERMIGRMNRLIGDLLDVASIEAGNCRLREP